MKGKRGQAILSSLIYTVVELAIVAMFIAAVLIKVNVAVNDDTYQKRFYARDLALLTDSMMAAEGDFQMQHEIVTQKILDVDINLKPVTVAIMDHEENGENVPSEISFLFGTNPHVAIKPTASRQNTTNTYETSGKYLRSVSIKKENGTIFIQEAPKIENKTK